MQRNHWRARVAGLTTTLGLLLVPPALAQAEAPPAPSTEALQAELEARTQQVTLLMQALNARNLRIAELELTVARLTQALETATKRADRVQELEAQLDAKSTRLSQVEAAAATLFTQRDALKKEIEQLKAEQEALQTQVTSLTEALEAARTEAQQQTTRAEDLQAQLNAQTQQLTEAQATIAALTEEVEQLKAERDRLQAALEEARNRLTALEGTAARTTRSLEQVADELELALRLARALTGAYPTLAEAETAASEVSVLGAQLRAAERITARLANARGVYTVQPGDSLSSIAAFFYRDATRWTDILEANRGVLEDPNRLEPGMVLVIPR